MRTTINIEKARELGLPIPENAAAMILYEVVPASEFDEIATAVDELSERAPKYIGHLEERLNRERYEHDKTRRALLSQLDAEQALRKGLEQELEDALAKLTEPPTKPKPTDPPADTPAEKPKKKVNG